MRTSEHRKTSYSNKVATTGTQERYTAIIAAQQSNMGDQYESFAKDFVPYQMLASEVLDHDGVLRIVRGPYFAMFGEVYHVYKTCTGSLALQEVGFIKTKWTDRGLAAATLQKLIEILFPATP
jgi:hypothetical protein